MRVFARGWWGKCWDLTRWGDPRRSYKGQGAILRMRIRRYWSRRVNLKLRMT